MITLPDGKICNNLPEQVAENAKDIFEVAQQWQPYKEELEADFEILATYLADMSSAAVGAIAGQNIAPANVAATASVSAPSITGDSIIENMSGYSYNPTPDAGITANIAYAGAVKNGNKLTFAIAGDIELTTVTRTKTLGTFTIPLSLANKLYPISGTVLAYQKLLLFVNDETSYETVLTIYKESGNKLRYSLFCANTSLVPQNTVYQIRIETTFLLSDNLAS